MKPINLNYLFWIRKSRAKNNKAPLYLRIIYKGKRKEINLNHNLDPSIWDSDSHRAMGRSPEARATNQVIFKSIDRIEQILFEYESENKLLTLETFKTLFYGEEPEEENWLGGFKKDGEPVASIDSISECLKPKFKQHSTPFNLSYVIRHNSRKYEVLATEVSIWIKN